jgi:hypothetical protein
MEVTHEAERTAMHEDEISVWILTAAFPDRQTSQSVCGASLLLTSLDVK